MNTGNADLYLGDCREVMATMDANSIDAIVTDPPYGLEFMGKEWDRLWATRDKSKDLTGKSGSPFLAAGVNKYIAGVQAQDWHYTWAVEALRIAKPGAHLLAFGGTRTHHRLMCAIEDAGWEIRDTVMWVYGSGFPKSLDVSKAIDKAAGVERLVERRLVADLLGERELAVTYNGASNIGRKRDGKLGYAPGNEYPIVDRTVAITSPATDAARQWQGWGTALKPAWEPIIMARKPLDGTVAENAQKWGAGAINVDACRVGTSKNVPYSPKREAASTHTVSLPGYDGGSGHDHTTGRWPANLIHDGSDEVLAGFPERNVAPSGPNTGKNRTGMFKYPGHATPGSDGSAARFFYCAKASKTDRDEGCEDLDAKRTTFADGTGLKNNGDGTPRNQHPSSHNTHPTVKPTALMRYLCRLVTPPGGIVLDPFMGSGSTGKAAIAEGFRFVGIETDQGYFDIARARIRHAQERVADVAPLFAEQLCSTR